VSHPFQHPLITTLIDRVAHILSQADVYLTVDRIFFLFVAALSCAVIPFESNFLLMQQPIFQISVSFLPKLRQKTSSILAAPNS